MKRIPIIAVLFVLAMPLMATIVVPPSNLAEMAYESDLVIYATAESHQNGNEYANNFRIIETIKGNVNEGDIVIVEEYGGGELNGMRTVISGDVDFKLGYNYMLFLSQVGSGNYKARQLSMGVFEEGMLDNQDVLGRTGDILDLALAGETLYNYNELTGLYKTADFVSHLKAVMNSTSNWNYLNAGFVVYENTAQGGSGTNSFVPQGQLQSVGPCPNNAPCHCSTLFGPPGTSQTKYENNTWTVCVVDGAQNDPTTTTEIADLQTAISFMDGMQGINISYTGIDAATSTVSCGTCLSGNASGAACDALGYGGDCNKMYVFFDDPCGQIPDVNAANCTGTLGIGGHFSSGSHVDACGDTWNTACVPYFVMNNFGVCAPNTVDQDDYIAVLVHEMLHAVGVGHHYDADAFTTTAAGDNACGTGAITHNGSECTGVMNPVLCNSPAPSAGNNYSISALDNACTDWMYNITSATTCVITNVTLNTTVSCNGNNAEFEVCFDVTDGSGAYDIEVGGNVEVNAAAGATSGNVCISASVVGPTASGMTTVNVRDDATFACVDDTNLQVNLLECPPPCAATCTDASTNSCSTAVLGTDVFPAAYADLSENCQQTVVTASGAGTASITQCFEYTALTPAFAVTTSGSVVSSAPADCDLNTALIEVYEPGCANPLDITATNTYGNAIVGSVYTVCVTGELSTTGADCDMDCLAHAVTPLGCAGSSGSTVAPVCSNENFTINLGNPSTAGSQDGFFLMYDSDPSTPETQQELYDDIFGIVDDPDLSYAGETSNVSGAGFANLSGFANTGCDVLTVDLYLLPGNLAGSLSPSCPVEGPVTLTIYPEVQAPATSEDAVACTTTVTSACAGDTFGAASGATGDADAANWNAATGVYTAQPGDAVGTINVEVNSGGTCTGSFTINTPACAAAACTVAIDVAGAESTCDQGANPIDPADDTFTVTTTATVTNGSGQYIITDGTTTWGPFANGAVGTAGPFTADGATTTGALTIEDSADNACSVALGDFGPVAACPDAPLAFTVSLTDPCVCDNNQTDNAGATGDGTFSETVVVDDANAGQTYTITASSIPTLVGQTLIYNAVTMEYEISFNHDDGVGYEVTIEGPGATGTATNTTESIANMCYYPEIALAPALASPYCNDDNTMVTLGVTETDGDNTGVATFTVNGAAAADFTPSALGDGTYPIVATWTGAGGNGQALCGGVPCTTLADITANSASVAAGCNTELTTSIVVQNCTAPCNAAMGTWNE